MAVKMKCFVVTFVKAHITCVGCLRRKFGGIVGAVDRNLVVLLGDGAMMQSDILPSEQSCRSKWDHLISYSFPSLILIYFITQYGPVSEDMGSSDYYNI